MGKRRQEVVITHITVAYLFLAFVTSLVVVELTNGKPAVKSNLSNLDNKINISEPYPIQDTPQQDTFNSQRKN